MTTENTEFIKNPKTGRPLKVGSKTWEKLVKDGLLIDHGFKESDCLYELKEGENYETAKKKIKKTLPMGIMPVLGHGKNQGKLVARRSTPTTHEIVKKTSKLASKTIIRNQQGLEDCASQEELEQRIEELLLNEMVMLPRKEASKIKMKLSKPVLEQSGDEEDYAEANSQEEEEEHFSD